jgi:hypothetical protein
MTETTQLARYDAMCSAIDAAYEVDEVKDIRDKAVALEMYSRLAHNTENERRACEIRLRAERKAGQLLRQMQKAKGGRPSKTLSTTERVLTKAEQLEAAGVTTKQAHQWEKLADVPQEQFDAALADPTTKPTTAGIIRANVEPLPLPDVETMSLEAVQAELRGPGGATPGERRKQLWDRLKALGQSSIPAPQPSVDEQYDRVEREARAAQSPPPETTSTPAPVNAKTVKVTETAWGIKRATSNKAILSLCDFIINREWQS